MNLLPPPGPQRTRQLVALAAVVVALAGVGWWLYGPGAGPALPASTTPGQNAGASDHGGTKAGPAALPQPLELASLDPDADPSPEPSSRDPFRFGEPPKPPTPPYVPPPPPTLAELAMRQAQAAPQVPPIPLQLEGLETMVDGVRRATLKDPATGRVFQGIEGAVIDGRYRLEKIGLESVVMSYLDGSGRRTIPKSQ